MLRLIFVVISCAFTVFALDNGLARTPPMGWLSWERFRCITDCDLYPNECINEQLFKDMADVMASEGYLEAGYEYVIIDDCWLTSERDEDGRLQADPERFPNGIKALADYIHSKGLKFGIYEDYGTHTCAGYPGSEGHLKIDADTFAAWGVDYLKLDGCNSNPADQEKGTAELAYHLNATGRPILFSCEYPLYEMQGNIKTNYTKAGEICNMWRNYWDVQDSWTSVTGIMTYYGKNQDDFQEAAGPGSWNDPDMLSIGNFGLSYDQSKAQMATWAVLASPLIMSTDLRTIKPEFKELLLNKEVLAISQDPLGIQGRLIASKDNIDIWRRPVTPVVNGKKSYAIAVVSRRDDGNPFLVNLDPEQLGLENSADYEVKDIFDPKQTFQLKDLINVRFLYKIDSSQNDGIIRDFDIWCRMLPILLFIVWITTPIYSLDNGLAITPPMGWMPWQRFRCTVDCVQYPDECISEKMFKDMADVMSSEGYGEAGYQYIIIDDCWMANERDENGKLQPDPERFPSGIKALADYIHGKGLKFGIYEDYGTHTCAGYPGILGHLETDAKTFAEWDVDYLKLDGCYSELSEMVDGYDNFGDILNATGRPIVYSCSYPAYEEVNGILSDYKILSENCNLWRNYYDIDDSWASVVNIIDYYTKHQDRFGPFAGPGHWNDPDMLIIGNFGLSFEQSRAQMALWAIFASPLIMSVDLRTIRPEFKEILLDKDVIAINQDSLGIQGRKVLSKNKIDIYTKPIQPIATDNNHSYGIAFLSKRTDGMPYKITVTLQEIGLNNKGGYAVQNVFEKDSLVFMTSTSDITVRVNPTGVVLLKAIAL
ncbi:uncharacterized protein CBL_04034 [Carabus blaptoides fortunei]